MFARLTTVGVAASLLAACGSAPPAFTASPQTYLVAIDQLGSAGFTVESGTEASSPSDLARGDAATARRLVNSGLRAAATVSYARVVDFPMSNGPVEVSDTVERFGSSDGASVSFAADLEARDAGHGEVAISTGPLGDEAHADSLVMTAPDGVPAVQITLEWRVANVVVVLVVRGRYGGTRLEDALLLAHRQTSMQLGQR